MVTEQPGLEQIYRAQYAALVRLAWSLTGSRRAAEDVVQDVFARAQRDWCRLVEHENVDAWLRRSVINACHSRWRRLRTEAAYLARRRVEVPVELAPAVSEVWSAVRQLSSRQREVIALVYVDDLSLTRAAEVLGCGVDTVRTHHRRALERLARLLGEEGAHDEDR